MFFLLLLLIVISRTSMVKMIFLGGTKKTISNVFRWFSKLLQVINQDIDHNMVNILCLMCFILLARVCKMYYIIPRNRTPELKSIFVLSFCSSNWSVEFMRLIHIWSISGTIHCVSIIFFFIYVWRF